MVKTVECRLGSSLSEMEYRLVIQEAKAGSHEVLHDHHQEQLLNSKSSP